MENISYIVFICFALPFLLGIPIVRKQTRQVLLFTFIGMCCCLFISEVNGLLNASIGQDLFYVTTNITPLTEELIKMLPILVYAIFISSERQALLTIAFMTGLGFALLENSTILVETVVVHGSIDILWALIRTLGAGLLHSLCTTAVGVGISFIRDQKKIFLCGTFALLSSAIVNDWGEASANQAIALTEYFIDHYNINKSKVYLHGYSGGGETGSLVMGMRPELYTALLMTSSQWDDDLEVLANAKTPVFLATGENDSYYGSQPLKNAYKKLRGIYESQGLTETEIDKNLVLDVKNEAYFTERGYTDQHGGGMAFAHDETIMNWLFKNDST